MRLKGRIGSELTGGAVMDVVTTAALGAPRETITKEFQMTAFDGPFSRWTDVGSYRYPPSRLVLAAPWRDEGSTAAALISHSMRRLVEEGVALPAKTYPVVTGPGAGVAAGTTNYRGQGVLDSAFSPRVDELWIGGGYFPCGTPATSASECRRACTADADCPGGQHCAKESDAEDGCAGGACYCAWPSQGTWKFVTTHELGHLVQNALTGGIPKGGASYGFSCVEVDEEGKAVGGATACPENLGRLELNAAAYAPFPYQLTDPPLMDPICGCQHVTAANAMHCLQSVERVPHADGEGYAQFFSALMWNRPSGQSCRFNYYKEMLDVGAESCRVRLPNGDPDPLACKPYNLGSAEAPEPGTVSFPPVAVDCKAPAKWRNQNRCAVSGDLEPLEKPTMGTEYDYMTFLFDVNSRVGLNDVMSIYKHGCWVDDLEKLGTNCEGGRPIAWVDGVIGGRMQPDGSIEGGVKHGGFLSGARRKYGLDDPQANFVLDSGTLHGVSEDTMPLGQ